LTAFLSSLSVLTTLSDAPKTKGKTPPLNTETKQEKNNTTTNNKETKKATL